MGEIKFRGKRADNGEWAYGNLIIDDVTGKCWIDLSINEDSQVDGYLYVYALEVIPTTVGQYTGLKDKNCKEIYEGDVVKTKYENCPKNEHIENVVFYNGSFRSTNKEETCYCLLYDGTSHLAFDKSIYMSEIEVIGTIHDKEVKQ